MAVLNLIDSSDPSDIRASISNWLRKNAEFKLENNRTLGSYLVGVSWENYCHLIETGEVWGDPIQLFAIVEVFGITVNIVSSVVGSYIVRLEPSSTPTNFASSVLLFHHNQLHFGVLENATSLDKRILLGILFIVYLIF